MNNVTLIGRLTREPELRYTPLKLTKYIIKRQKRVWKKKRRK